MAYEQARKDARDSIQDAINFSFDEQQPDGHWVAEVSADVTFTAEYIMFKYAMGMDLSDADALQRWLLLDQKEDGSWALAPNHPGNVSTTTEAYLALKILGVPLDDPAMLRARDFIIRNGGVAKVRFFTRFFLATFGLIPWSAIPQIPAELILMPASSPLNIYTLSSWARSTMIPILIVRHHEPVYALPNGSSPANDWLDEIWVEPGNKNIPFAPSLSHLLWERDIVQFGFTAADKILALLGGLKHFPLRQHSRNKCIEWLLEHQESAGDWAGFFPPMHGSVWALILEGYPLDHKRVRLGMDAIERLSISDARGKRIAPTVSPVWDTALMVSALCDAGVRRDARVGKAVDWVKARQLLGPQGDWRVYSPNEQAGGWSFEYENTWYPDVDDTAVIVIALIKHDPDFIGSVCISNAVKWILGMQGPDGGYGAFDYDNNKTWLHKIPFSDMDSLCDPSSADITGRVLECFGFLLSHRQGSWDRNLMLKVNASSERAIAYLLSEQETAGASAGAWWGRWGNNYNYGTGNVLRGLVHFAHRNADVRRSVARAIRWFESVQNTDGGWGEDLLSYVFPEMAGRGESTAAQTAWALLALQPYRSYLSPAVEKGIRWLVSNQKVQSEHGRSWPTHLYTATGFPKVLYLGYPYYHHLFPMMALTKYIHAYDKESFKAIELPTQILEPLNRPSVLLMAVGSRGDIQVFLSIAKLLSTSYGYRVRIATHPLHQSLVEQSGIEFYSVGGNPATFAKVFTESPNVLLSLVKGELQTMRDLFGVMVDMYWRSSIDSHQGTNVTEKPQKLERRPFFADTIVASLPTLAHIHCAEKLQIPLLLVSVQPVLPTSDFPHVFTLTKPRFQPGHPWNYMSFIMVELLNWLALGSYLNYLRVKVYRMKPVSWTWTAYEFLKLKIPHICLWSPSILPRPAEWHSEVTIAGYTFEEEFSFSPPKALESFLETKKPVLAVSFGSASVLDATKLMNVIFAGIEKIEAKGIICLNQSRIDSAIAIPKNIYLADQIPHGWLLPRVQGFVHHGGAGHTAIGLKFGVPMLIMPFFLDQNFWAFKIHELQLGPPALDYRILTVEDLVSSLKDLISHKYQQRCEEMAAQIRSQPDGADIATETVARLQVSASHNAYCDIIRDLKAPWKHNESGLHLSGAAAACLASHNVLSLSDLSLEPGVDWSERRAAASTRWIQILNRLTAMLWRLISLIPTVLYWLFTQGVKFEVEDDFTVGMRDPVREARMKQGEYDLRFITQQTSELEEGPSIEDRIIRNWQVLSTAEFHAKFTGRSEKGQTY
ncbi:MAG: hypothetical protein Q9166_005600 [cf. Caloplaca sp. 2 TL-2023]